MKSFAILWAVIFALVMVNSFIGPDGELMMSSQKGFVGFMILSAGTSTLLSVPMFLLWMGSRFIFLKKNEEQLNMPATVKDTMSIGWSISWRHYLWGALFSGGFGLVVSLVIPFIGAVNGADIGITQVWLWLVLLIIAWLIQYFSFCWVLSRVLGKTIGGYRLDLVKVRHVYNRYVVEEVEADRVDPPISSTM